MLITLSKYDWYLAEHFARHAAVGGVSRVRAEDDRQASLGLDQLVGQVGTLALCKYLYGHVQPYVVSRHVQNRFPTHGDGGEDLPGSNVDIKTSLMRYGQDPLRYNLCVRPKERHAGWVYILALVPDDFQTSRQCHLVGWTTDEALPAVPKADGPLAGAYVVPATELTPLPPIQYDWLA